MKLETMEKFASQKEGILKFKRGSNRSRRKEAKVFCFELRFTGQVRFLKILSIDKWL